MVSGAASTARPARTASRLAQVRRLLRHLLADERRPVSRMLEVFAGFTEHTDAQIGRLVDFLEQRDKMRDTLFIVLSDNGASGEYGEYGSVNEYRYFLGLKDTLKENLEGIDQLGGPWTHNHYPPAWAQAGNAPLKFYKKYTFGGGVRAPLIGHWPQHFGEPGETRPQFHHAIDLAPTMLDLAGVSAPMTYRGIPQLPLHGTSLGYTFLDAAAKSTRDTQYFEMGGQRGLYHDGWKAVTNHRSGEDYDADVWELYDLANDYSECVDLAAQEPHRLKSMIAMWWQEAERYNVLPLDDRAQARAFARDPATTNRVHFSLYPGTRLLTPVTGPNFSLRPFRITATASRSSSESQQGVLLAYGRRAAGFVLYVQDNRLVFDYNRRRTRRSKGSGSRLSGASRNAGWLRVADVVRLAFSRGFRCPSSSAVSLRGRSPCTRLDGVDFQTHAEALTNGAEDRGKVVHARIAFRRQHPVQALAWLVGDFSKLLEAKSCVDQIAQDEARRFRLTVQEQSGRLVQQALGKSRIALDTLDHCVLEVASQCHLFTFVDSRDFSAAAAAFFLRLYSACSALALSMSRCCPRFVPPPKSTMSVSPSLARSMRYPGPQSITYSPMPSNHFTLDVLPSSRRSLAVTTLTAA